MPKYIIQNGKAIRVDKMPKSKKIEVKEIEPKGLEVSKEVEEDLEKLTLSELKELAEKYDIEVEKKTKKELIEEIKEKVGG